LATSERKKREGQIEEVEAMILLHKSPHVVKLIDHFEIDGETFIASKFAQGGDLLNYCLTYTKSDCWLSEDRARHIFI